MKSLCPQCGSPNRYIEGINYACMMCGRRWPINGAKPIIIKKEDRDIDDADIKKMEEGKEMATRACRNCGRVRKIIGDDLDSGCYYVVRKLTKGTPEYDAALAKAKIKFSDPNYKRTRKTLVNVVIQNKLSAEKIKKIKTHVRALGIKQNGGDPKMAGVIATLQIEREVLLARTDKLTQAIELLSA
jgi:hypothetical protein